MKHALPAAAACLTAACLASADAAQSAQDADPRVAAIRAYADDYRERAVFDGVILIAENGAIVVEEAFGAADRRFARPMAPDVRFRIASLSKQVTQAAVARLVDRGLVELDAPVSTYLPDFPEAERMTVRQLLENAAGVPHTNTLDWMDMTRGFTLAEILQRLGEEPLDYEPGTSTRYSNGGYAVAAAVVEAASGMSYAAFLESEFAEQGYPSIGHEAPFAVVENMAHRYAPGPRPGERAEATTYVAANRVGGGSLHATAEDVFRFFRDSITGALVSEEMTEALFAMPEDGDVRITGRAPGALAQIYYDVEDDLAVVTLSSNSGWPASFNADVTALWRGEEISLRPAALAPDTLSSAELSGIPGRYEPDRFSWSVELRAEDGALVYVQDDLRTAFAKTEAGDFYLPIWDWLCAVEDGFDAFVCRQRDPDSDAEFAFRRVSETP